jgi:hypothetical protein
MSAAFEELDGNISFERHASPLLKTAADITGQLRVSAHARERAEPCV